MRGVWPLLMLGLLELAGPTAEARIRNRSQHRSFGLSRRSRLDVNSLITDPGTSEVETYGVFSPDGQYQMPMTWKVTPGREGGFWSRTELSTSFDAVVVHDTESGKVTQTTDHLTFASTTVLGSLGPVLVAASPTATFWLRDNSGARLGAILYGKVENDRHQGGVTLSYSGATSASATNPAGTFDAAVGYGIRLRKDGLLQHFTAHTSFTWERSTGIPSLYNLGEGVEYEVNDKLSFDLSAQQNNIAYGGVDNQVVLGVTWNLGPVRRHH